MINTVIGLGQAGCAIATQFSLLEHYRWVYRIDSQDQEIKSDKCKDFFFAKQSKPEDYETKVPNLKKFFKDANREVLFIVAGGGNISLSSLVILEQIKRKREITLLYIKPDVEFLGAEAKSKEKVTYNVFQEYARSGLFKRLYVISNVLVERAMGGVSIISYYEKLNQTIVHTFHLMNMVHNMKPVTSTISAFPVGARISSFGLTELDNDEEKMFFNIDIPTDIVYYFAYNEAVLKSDVTLLNRIKTMVRKKIEDGITRVSYGVFATNYDKPFVICSHNTSMLQK